MSKFIFKAVLLFATLACLVESASPIDSKEVLEQALRLKSEERFIVVEGLLRSLDEPDRELDALWAEEAELRLRAYRPGKLAGVPLEDVFEDEE